MKIKLSLKERLVISELLPQQGSITEQITARAIIKKVEITSDEVDKWEIRDIERGVVWNAAKAEDLEYELNKTELQLLKSGVEKLDKEKKITQGNLDLCQKVKGIK